MATAPFPPRRADWDMIPPEFLTERVTFRRLDKLTRRGSSESSVESAGWEAVLWAAWRTAVQEPSTDGTFSDVQDRIECAVRYSVVPDSHDTSELGADNLSEVEFDGVRYRIDRKETPWGNRAGFLFTLSSKEDKPS